jgi:hypothetical protein
LLMLNATLNNISGIKWRSVLIVEENGGPGETTNLPQVSDKLYHILLYTPQYKCFQYGKISNFILVQLNINHAIYVLNFLHVERWHIFEVFNHIYNAIFKYNVIYYIGRII